MSAEVSLFLTVAMSLGLSAILVYVLSKPLLLSVVSLSSQDGQQVVGVLRTTLVATLFGAFIALLVIGLRISMASPRTRTH